MVPLRNLPLNCTGTETDDSIFQPNNLEENPVVKRDSTVIRSIVVSILYIRHADVHMEFKWRWLGTKLGCSLGSMKKGLTRSTSKRSTVGK